MVRKLKTLITVIILLPITFINFSNLLIAQQNITSENKPLLLVHYMPWYQTPEVNGYWGWHWTMNHFNPNNIIDDGYREIASHFYPLTGPYDSSDDDILEYQVLLMKICGIDGVIVDWYGIEDFWDYKVINDATNSLFEYIEKSNLLFVICYEDQTIGHMVNNNHISESKVYDHGKDVMHYLQANWFNSHAYFKFADKPVLLNFGPQYFYNSSDWDSIFSDLDTSPHFFTLDNRLEPVAAGAFPWPPMWASEDGVLTQNALKNYLSDFYQKSVPWEFLIAGSFPGFYDIYNEAGLGFSYGYLDAQDGATFDFTLQMALNNDPDVVQIVTWNDYGEGTTVEPTVEFEYQYLEKIQGIKKSTNDTTFNFKAEDLRLPIQLFDLRKLYKHENDINKRLDDVFYLLIRGEVVSAITILDSVSSLTNIVNRAITHPIYILLDQNYPNPFNSTTTISFYLSEPMYVNLSVYNVGGQLIETLINSKMNTGIHSIKWDAENMSSGVYYYIIVANFYSVTKKLILLK